MDLSKTLNLSEERWRGTLILYILERLPHSVARGGSLKVRHDLSAYQFDHLRVLWYIGHFSFGEVLYQFGARLEN